MNVELLKLSLENKNKRRRVLAHLLRSTLPSPIKGKDKAKVRIITRKNK